MNTKLAAVLLMTLLFSVPAFCGTGIMKTGHSAKTVYLAKSGQADDTEWDIRWSTDYAVAGSSVIYSEKKWDKTNSSFVGKIYSIVGPYISYKGMSEGYSQGAAHPWQAVYFETVDMTGGKKVRLTDIFDPDDIFKALLNDGVIKKALGKTSPKNLEDLLSSVDGGCEFYLGHNSLESFVFHHVKDGRVAVRLGLGHGCEAMRGKFTQLGFYLPIPPPLKNAFETASKKELLMNNMANLPY